MAVTRSWAPLGADRFYAAVRAAAVGETVISADALSPSVYLLKGEGGCRERRSVVMHTLYALTHALLLMLAPPTSCAHCLLGAKHSLISRRRECHSAGTPLSIRIETRTEGRGEGLQQNAVSAV